MTNIEIRTVSGCEQEKLPLSLYEGVKKQWSNRGVFLPGKMMQELQKIVEQYLRVMGLEGTRFPVRVDIGFTQKLSPIIYEITTGFVDQVGSCLALQQSFGDDSGLAILAQTPFDSSILTELPYKPEYDLMREMFQRSGRFLEEGVGENCYVYGYPREYMGDDQRYIPSWRGLRAEEKETQIQVLSRLSQGADFMVPRFFSGSTTGYQDLPEERNTKLVFKQKDPKIKGARNTVIFGKGKEAEKRYKEGEMLAQEFYPPFRDENGERYEAKVLFMPTSKGCQYMGMYSLVDATPQSKNFGNTKIPNDGYPQGPGMIIS